MRELKARSEVFREKWGVEQKRTKTSLCSCYEELIPMKDGASLVNGGESTMF